MPRIDAAGVQPARGLHRSLRATLFMAAGAALLTWSQVALRTTGSGAMIPREDRCPRPEPSAVGRWVL